MEKIFDIHIVFKEYAEVKTPEELVKLISFGGKTQTRWFTGEVLPGGVDVQTLGADGTGKVSARYILQGMDQSGMPCKVYVENEGIIDERGAMHTMPKVLTDSVALAWLNSTQLHCEFASVGEEFHVQLFAEEIPTGSAG